MLWENQADIYFIMLVLKDEVVRLGKKNEVVKIFLQFK